jgi:F-type H+-transporting ATPase subunit gamma
MQKLVEVRKRVSTVRSIRSVASVLATVASAKLSRTRERAAGVRAYAERMRAIVRRQQVAAVAAGVDLVALSPFLQPHDEVRRVLLVHIAGDRGMCGSYNSAIDREAGVFIRSRLADGVAVAAIAKGLKGEKYLRRRTEAEVVDAGGWPRGGVLPDEVDALCDRLSEAFLSGDADEVWCTYTRFYSPLRRYPTTVRLLPLTFESADLADVTGAAVALPERWFYEPDRETIVNELLGIFLRLQVFDVLLESYAAEQGARMVTMEEATERADRSLQELTVAYNRLRRESITTDLLGVLVGNAVREAEEDEAASPA